MPTPMGLSLLAAFEELDAQRCARKSRVEGWLEQDKPRDGLGMKNMRNRGFGLGP